ncbi:MAG TPA: hypothetical protein VMU51_11190 [Mycobacteriales bacterium]|nr:hypothetical protein [Mycobacteriales bacterium]
MTPASARVERVAVIGDIGGQATAFRQTLHALGAEPATQALPPGLGVIQVGDLVRAGAGPGLDNDDCVHLATHALQANPGRWTQLFGNHDLALIGGPTKPDWPGPPAASPDTVERLQQWWTERTGLLAAALTCREHGQVLITHAGLTRTRWNHLGRPHDAADTAALINQDLDHPVQDVIIGGALTDTRAASPPGPDVAWAAVNTELYQPWLNHGDMPYTQIHGHAAPLNWTTGTWWPDTTPAIRAATTTDPTTRRTTTRLTDDGHLAISVDPNLGNHPTHHWPPLTLTLTNED